MSVGCWVLFAQAAQTAQAEPPDDRFSAATRAMEASDYGEAAYQLRELPREGKFSHGAQHNLGNAEWRVVRPGHAVLAWERAALLDPADANTAANLAYARSTARGFDRVSTPVLAWHETYSTWLRANAWLALASVGLWGGVGLLALPRLFAMRRADWHQGVAALLLAIFLLTVPALIGLRGRSTIGIALEDETPLRLTPTREGERLAVLRAGDWARVEKERGPYLYVRGEGDSAGWVRREEFERVW